MLKIGKLSIANENSQEIVDIVYRVLCLKMLVLGIFGCAVVLFFITIELKRIFVKYLNVYASKF